MFMPNREPLSSFSRSRGMTIFLIVIICLLIAACEGGENTPAVTSTPSSAASTPTAAVTVASTATSMPQPTATLPAPASTPSPSPRPVATPVNSPAPRNLAGLIAFISDRFERPEIYLFDIDRNEVSQWTNDSHAKRNPAWAPDGKVTPLPGTREAFEKYLQLDPNGAFAESARGMIASISSQVETTYSNPSAPAKKAAKKK